MQSRWLFTYFKFAFESVRTGEDLAEDLTTITWEHSELKAKSPNEKFSKESDFEKLKMEQTKQWESSIKSIG